MVWKEIWEAFSGKSFDDLCQHQTTTGTFDASSSFLFLSVWQPKEFVELTSFFHGEWNRFVLLGRPGYYADIRLKISMLHKLQQRTLI